jgi:hypothetical protein
LDAVLAERRAEALQDLPLPREHQARPAGGDAGAADLLRDGGAFLPEPDDRRVDVVEAAAQRGDVRVGSRCPVRRSVGAGFHGDGDHFLVPFLWWAWVFRSRDAEAPGFGARGVGRSNVQARPTAAGLR